MLVAHKPHDGSSLTLRVSPGPDSLNAAARLEQGDVTRCADAIRGVCRDRQRMVATSTGACARMRLPCLQAHRAQVGAPGRVRQVRAGRSSMRWCKAQQGFTVEGGVLEGRDSVFTDIVKFSRSAEGQQAWDGARHAVDGGAQGVVDALAGLEVFPGRGVPLTVLFYAAFFLLAGAVLTRSSKQ